MQPLFRTGPLGLAIIKSSEKLMTRAYRDVVGVWTIGYGHTAAAGAPAPHDGMYLTPAQCEALLKSDLKQYEDAVWAVLKRTPTQNQFDAMVSLCYNIGAGNFATSGVVRKFNTGDVLGAANAFRGWRKAKGRVWPGLVTRRERERSLFLS